MYSVICLEEFIFDRAEGLMKSINKTRQAYFFNAKIPLEKRVNLRSVAEALCEYYRYETFKMDQD